MSKKLYFYFTFLLYNAFTITLCRSSLRKSYNTLPRITTEWQKNKHTKKNKVYELKESHLELYPLFETFDPLHFKKASLPTKGTINYRNSTCGVPAQDLNALLEKLITDIRDNKKALPDFDILKDRDFNWKKQAGLIVVKPKKYPFVFKVFMETPRSFLKPHNKGFEPHCFFVIGGGSTRHLVGFTRIKNAQSIKERLLKSDYWGKRVDVPRKWFWTPEDNNSIILTGYNIGNHAKITTVLPATYVIIADAIEKKREFNVFSYHDRRYAIDLSNYLLCRIDPHITNFMVEKSTGKVVIIDTEHFPTLVGFKERPRITSYTSWYLRLLTKYMQNRFLRTKKERLALQSNPQKPFSLP